VKFVALARTAVPELLDHVAALTARLAEAEARAERAESRARYESEARQSETNRANAALAKLAEVEAALEKERERWRGAELASSQCAVLFGDSQPCTALAAALARVREVEEERDRLREYQHHVVCNCDRKNPIGSPTCVCEIIPKHAETNDLAAARAEEVRRFAEWEADNHSGHFTPSDLRDDADRYLAQAGKEHG
jgi:hypothetical protein